MENLYNLDLIAHDLLYYGYNYQYFKKNYGQEFDDIFLRKIWNDQKTKLSKEF